MELTTGLLSRGEYLQAMAHAVESLRSVKVRVVQISYGFGCDCPDEQLYQDIPIPVEHLLPFVSESEAADFYRVGKDNLYLRAPDGGPEILFCHESDIHFFSHDQTLMDRLREDWSLLEYPLSG